MAVRRRPPDYLPRDVLTRPEFVRACQARKLGAILRLAHHWGGPGFSKSHLSRRCGLTLTQVNAYMRGRTAVSIDVFERVSDGLHIPGKMLGISDRPWEMDNGSDAGAKRPEDWVLLTPWTVAGTLVSAREVSEVNPVDRRSFVFLTGAAVTAPAHEWLLARPLNEVAGAGGRSIRPELVDDLGEITAKLRGMDDEMGGGPLVDLVRSQAAYVAGLLRDGRYTDSVGRRLHAVLGELLRLAGWVSFDGGDQAQAQRFWFAALHAAHTAGDRALGANILGFMSEQAESQGRPHDAARLAATGLAGYKGSSPRVTAILHMREARSHAMLGAAGDCQRSIDAAENALSSPQPQSGEPGWSYWMDEGSLNRQAGRCFLYLGDFPAACQRLETALGKKEWEEIYARDGVSGMITLATAHARQGEPEQACAVGGRAVDTLAGQVDSGRLAARLRQIGKDLRPYQNVPAVREFSDKVAGLAGRESR